MNGVKQNGSQKDVLLGGTYLSVLMMSESGAAAADGGLLHGGGAFVCHPRHWQQDGRGPIV